MAQLLVARACAKLRSAAGDEVALLMGLTGDLQEMSDTLEGILQPRLEKAEVPQSTGVSMGWQLEHVKRDAYRMMDMVDELQDTSPAAGAAMTRMLPCFAIKNAMATKVERMKNHVRELIEFTEMMDSKFSVEELRHHARYKREIISHCTEVSAIGRGADKQRIVSMLLSAASNITQGRPSCIILPIFGLPGSGKTTLAQMVFKDDTHSLQEYNFRVWVHVSPELDFHRIGKSILFQVMSGGRLKEEINGDGSNSDVEGMESIMKRLNELLNGKKVLLVLDDLWEDDPIQLELLKTMLTFLGDKVDVIVTTCNHAIARKMCTVVQPYRLNPLGDDACWEIIKKIVRFEEGGELEKIGPEIARKCWGVPLAALECASTLVRDYPTERGKVIEILDSYYHRASFKTNTLAHTLCSSYTSMPQELRLCFDYHCDIFPDGHNVVKDDLVHQWIALDFIEASEISSATEIAEAYITRLLDMSFFQTAKSDPTRRNDDEGAAMFIVHNFARWISLKLEGHYMVVTNCHGKLDARFDDYLKYPSMKLDDLRALRCVGCSKLEFNENSFSRNKRLRVLELKESSVQKLPDSICKLRHLGYLKISEFSGLVTLPDSFGDLTNLFYIDLSGCSALAALPQSFGDLINLSHVNLSRCHALVELPEQLQKLAKLVHLDLSFWSCFEGIGKGLGGLTNLEHLNLSRPNCYLAQHRSHIRELNNGLCKLTRLRYLNLSMCLNPIFYYHKSQEESLQYIKSCVSGLSSLEHLDLSHNTFLVDLPQCLGDLNKLHTLKLSGCIRLKRVREIMPLKFIALRNCRGLESCNFVARIIDNDDAYSSSSSNIVQLKDVDCEELGISCLENVRSKEEAQRIKLVEKQKLGKLKLSWTLDSIRSVQDSALLGELTPPSYVQCLEINGFDATCLPEYLGDLTSLRELKIVCCKQLKSFPYSIQKLTNLKDLCIFDCPELEKWCKLKENNKMLAHIPNKNYEEHGSTSMTEIKEDCRSTDEVEVA